MKSGVPQGSHLGPILFAIFIDDLCYKFQYAEFLLYADDLKLFHRISSPTDVSRLQFDLTQLVTWCTQNGMELNVKKCETISFSTLPIENQIRSTYTIHENTLENVKFIRDLGVIMDSKLNFKRQVNSVCSRANIVLGFIKRQGRQFGCPYVTKALYCGLVRSIIEYASIIWSPRTDDECKRLESNQKQFLLFALSYLPWEQGYALPAYEARLQLLGMQPLSLRRDSAKTVFVRDVLESHINVPALSSLIVPRQFQRDTRFATQFYVATLTTSRCYEKKETVNSSIRLFNMISNVYSAGEGRHIFKTKATTALRAIPEKSRK